MDLCSQSALLQLKPLKLGTWFREFVFVRRALGNVKIDLAIHYHSCQAPDHSSTIKTEGLTLALQDVPPRDSKLRRSKTRTRKMQQRLRPRDSGALVLRFQCDPVPTQRKSSHQIVSAITTRKDIIKGIRGEGKILEYSWHFLRDFCSSGIGIETFGRVSSLACRGKAVSVGISCFFSLSSSCTNRGRSCVCFRGRRSRKTERDEQKWQMESAQRDTWRCAKFSDSLPVNVLINCS